jgi:hypothetical protein
MIVRTWHGCVPLQHAEGFARHLERTGVEHAQSIAGNRGALVRQENQGEWAHFFLATYWQDLAAKTITSRSPIRTTTHSNSSPTPMCFSMKSRSCRRCRLMTGQVEDWPATDGCWPRESDVYLVWAASRRWVNVA